jgi:hypothetical protein
VSSALLQWYASAGWVGHAFVGQTRGGEGQGVGLGVVNGFRLP